MKSIFTYPNNPGTFYIDPLYIGNDTSGWQERMLNLKTGLYEGWPGASPGSTPLSTIMTGTGKYNEAFEETSGNNTVYQFWLQPMVECTIRPKGSITVANISLVNDGGIPKIRITSADDVSALVLGTELYGEGFTTAEMNFFDNPVNNKKYAVPIDTNNFYLAENAAGTEFDIDFLNQTIYNNKVNPNNSILPKSIRRDFGGVQGSIVKSFSSWPNLQYISDTDALMNLSVYNSANSGTLNALTPFYQTLMSGTEFTIEAFTNSAKTTRATVEEKYVEAAQFTYTATGDYVLQNITAATMISDWGMTQSQIDNLIAVEGTAAGWTGNYADGWCRIYATVTSGTFAGKINADDTIPENNPSYDYEFYWKYNGAAAEFSFYDQRGVGQDAQDFRITGTNPVDVEIKIEFIETGMPASGISPSYGGVTTDAGATLIENGLQGKFEINEATVILPGAEQFQFQDTNNATQPGAVWDNDAGWLAGAVTATALNATETKPTNGAITLDVNGRVSTIDFSGASSADRGIFDVATSPRLFKLSSAPNTYVPPVVTPAEAQDVWDTEDQWATNTYSVNPAKQWPRHVSPMSAEVNYSSPTIVNKSQSGIKYTRSAGHTKWTLDVVYPPMKIDDFKIFHAIAQAAHGQSTPFFFDLRSKNNDRILWGATYNSGQNTTTTPRIVTDIVPGDVLWLVEGFASDEANAFIQGEVFIDGENQNGNLHTSLSGTAANVFGEAKFRTPWPARSAINTGNIIYKDPFHAVVTLSDDNFSWETDNQDFYYVSVAFDLDQWGSV